MKHDAVPHWRHYDLDKYEHGKWVEQYLAKQGLKDPWLRYYAFKMGSSNLHEVSVLRRFFYPGITRGFTLAVLFIGATIAYDKIYGFNYDHPPVHMYYTSPQTHKEE